MKRENHLLSLPRTTSCKSTSKILPSNCTASSSSSYHPLAHTSDDKQLVRKSSSASFARPGLLSGLIRSLFNLISIPAVILPTCRWLTLPPLLSISSPSSAARKVTGTLFGHRRGHVSFAIQHDPRSEPVCLIKLAVSTSALVREMSSGLVRIALECEKRANAAARGGHGGKLYGEPKWTMYCNGRKCGHALTRECTESDWHVLSTVQTVSSGAGVIPVVDCVVAGGTSDGELLYMRARFERVVGSRDSEAFYMMNPDGTGGPELSIFLLRM